MDELKGIDGGWRREGDWGYMNGISGYQCGLGVSDNCKQCAGSR